jgi:plasmid maintenance system antidote protein VapI
MPKELSLPESLVSLTGVTLQDLASYIEVNPSNLSRFIDNTRTLPALALIKMAEMFTFLHGLPTHEPLPLSTEERTQLQEMAANCEFKRKKLEMQLTKVQQRYAQGLRMLQLLPTLEAKPENATERRQRWLAEQQYQAEKSIKDNGLVLQKKLTVSIALLQQEADAYLVAL